MFFFFGGGGGWYMVTRLRIRSPKTGQVIMKGHRFESRTPRALRPPTSQR